MHSHRYLNRLASIVSRWWLISLLLGSYNLYAANDPTNIGETSVLSIKQQEVLGRSWLRNNYKQLDPLNDIILQTYADELVKRLKQGPQLAPYNINLVIPNNRQFNAFAIPGGVIGINLGIFLLAESEGEFASVVAHELAHLSQEHFLRRLEYSKANNKASLGAIFAGLALLISGNVPLGTAAIVGAIGYQTEEFLRLSRQFENEADAQGLALLSNGKFDEREMSRMLGRLRSLDGNNQVAVYYRTHPLTADRMNYALQRARQYRKNRQQPLAIHAVEYGFARQRALFLAGRGGVESNKEDSKSNYDRIHDKIYESYSKSLLLLEQGEYAQAIKLLEKLRKEIPASKVILYSLLDAMVKDGRSAEAIKIIDDSLRYSTGSPMLEYYRSLAYANQENYGRAVVYMERVAEDYLENPTPWLQLSIYYGKLGDRYNLFRTAGVYHLLTGDKEKMQANFKLAQRAANEDKVKLAVLQTTYERFNL